MVSIHARGHTISLAYVAQLVGASSRGTKGHGFNSQSGNIPQAAGLIPIQDMYGKAAN